MAAGIRPRVVIGSQQSGRLQYDSIRIVKPRPPQVTTAAARDVTYSVAKSADYTRLWAYFSVKSLKNIGSCGFFDLIVKVLLLIWAYFLLHELSSRYIRYVI